MSTRTRTCWYWRYGDVVDRRATGVLMLVLVLFTAAVVPNLQPKSIAGRAGIGPVPPQPHIGECLLQNPPDPTAPASRQESYRLGTCTRQHYGEVAQVLQTAAAAPNPSALTSPEKDPCGDQAAYLGWKPPAGSIDGVRWLPIDVTVVDMVPVAIQQASGQRWVACVVTPLNAGASYTGSVRGALATGKLPTAYAACQFSVTVDRTGVLGCAQPHRYEIFAYAMLSPGYHDQKALDLQCRRIVTAAMGRADPSGAGALRISVSPFHWDSAGASQPGYADSSADPGSEGVCTVGVTGSRLLTGSLFGIGEKPLPWA